MRLSQVAALLVLFTVFLSSRAASSDTVLPTPESLLSSPSSATTAVSLTVDDILAESSRHEADSLAEADRMRKARSKPSGKPPARAGPKGNSMNELLNWAIEHSDPAALQQQAQAATSMTVEERKAAFEAKFSQEDFDTIFGTESEKMSVPIGVLVNATQNRTDVPSDEEVMRALQRLQEHVEDVDKANDLHKMGGLAPLQWLLQHRSQQHQVLHWTLYTLGTAAAHNPKVQQQQLEHEVLEWIVPVLHPNTPDTVLAKALYAVSTICGNQPKSIERLFALDGHLALEELFLASSSKIYLKLVALAHDMAELSAEWSDWLLNAVIRKPEALHAMLDGAEMTDLHDKVLVLMQGVVQRASKQQDLKTLDTLLSSRLKQYASQHASPEQSAGDELEEGYGLRAGVMASQLLTSLERVSSPDNSKEL